MAGTGPARRRRRLALDPCTLRVVALNFMDFSEMMEHFHRGIGPGPGCAPALFRRGRDQPRRETCSAYSTNSEDTDSACELRSMVSPTSAAHDNCRMRPHLRPSSD